MEQTRKQKKQATRELLVRAAKKLAVSMPLQDIQVNDITNEAGVAHGTFYIHFKNKEALFSHIIDRFNEEMRQPILEHLAEFSLEAPEPALTKMAHDFLDKLRKERKLISAFAGGFSNTIPLAWLHEGINPQMTAALATRFGAMKSGDVSAELVIHAALGIWARLGFRYALAARPKKAEYVRALVVTTLGAVSSLLETAKRKPINGESQ